ncbi:MAG: calcium-binding protein [Alphaproteobacteria bacterium]|nr:calcium-binding protein [Alphaproteobacteria bacterium]
MRVLVVIPHYFAAEAEGTHGSERADAAGHRAAALTATISGLRQHLGTRQWRVEARVLRGRDVVTPPGPGSGDGDLHVTKANRPHRASRLDVVVVTTGARHLLDRVALPDGWFETAEVDAPPRELGFACHDILAGRAGDYDWLCYVEDDVVVSDPLFLTKIAFVERHSDGGAVLMPNRYELLLGRHIEKLYVDGPVSESFTAAWQDIGTARRQLIRFLDGAVEIERASNPHAGCFFLSRRQFDHWRGRPWFGDRDASFIGPLESAASLGIMRCFRVYKPAPPCAGFLEAEHRNNREWLGFDP